MRTYLEQYGLYTVVVTKKNWTDCENRAGDEWMPNSNFFFHFFSCWGKVDKYVEVVFIFGDFYCVGWAWLQSNI